MSTSQDLDARAAELHRRAIIIDGHSDILMPVADGKMRLSDRVEVPDPCGWVPPAGVAEAARQHRFTPHTYYFQCMGQYDLPRFVEGGLTVQVCAIYIKDDQLDRALQRGLEMTWWLHQEVADNSGFGLVTSVGDILRLKREGRCGGILAFEGFEPLGFDLRFLDLYYQLGLRMASLTHSRRNFFADGPQWDVQTGGLTALGKGAVQRMNELGIVIDVGHLNNTGFWEVLDLTRHSVVYSHARTRSFFPVSESSKRYPGLDLSHGRERLEAIGRKGGVVGVMFYGQENVDDVIADIEYVIDLVGVDHVGLGSDLYGMERVPKGLEDMSRLPAVTRRLVERGHSDEVILKILGGNYLRVFEQVWKA